jgi:hypothetical protein
VILEYHRNGTKQTRNAVLHAVLHLLRNLCEWKDEILAWKGDTPNVVSLCPDTTVAPNDALAEKRAKYTDQLVFRSLGSKHARRPQPLDVTL